ncbi:MAG: hypothetical protein KGI71_03335, partial [Patescibacteria group bacterium]|nr:hypothetical protein [Patescibacteria group bacterium]
MRRALITILTILIIVGAGAALYFYYFMRSPSVAVTPNGSVQFPTANQQGTSTLPSIAPGTNVGTSSTPTAPVSVSARLVQISAGPVVPGEVVVDIPAANASSSPDVAVDYIERQSGNVYSYLVHAATLTRTSNKTIPGIQSAAWLPDASFAFVRYLSGTDFSTINTYALSSDGSSGFFLPQDLAGIDVSKGRILALASGVNGSEASVEHADGTHSSTVFTTPLSSLRTSFAGGSSYLAFTKPSAALA